MVSLPVVPAANPAAFSVVMLKATLGLEEIGGCLYNIASILTLWNRREVLPARPRKDTKREGGHWDMWAEAVDWLLALLLLRWTPSSMTHITGC